MRRVARPVAREVAKDIDDLIPLIELFEDGSIGVWYDIQDLSTMYSDLAGTTPAVVDGLVGYIEDKSGKGNDAVAAATNLRPTLRQDASGIYYLQFDGGNDELDFASALSDDYAVVVAAQHTSTITDMVVGNASGTEKMGTSSTSWFARMSASGTGATGGTSDQEPHVLTGILQDQTEYMRVDGVEVIDNTTGVNATGQMTTLGSADGSQAWGGNIYGMIYFTGVTIQKLRAAEEYMNRLVVTS